MQLALTSRLCHFCPLLYQCGPLVLVWLQLHAEVLCDIEIIFILQARKETYIYSDTSANEDNSFLNHIR